MKKFIFATLGAVTILSGVNSQAQDSKPPTELIVCADNQDSNARTLAKALYTTKVTFNTLEIRANVGNPGSDAASAQIRKYLQKVVENRRNSIQLIRHDDTKPYSQVTEEYKKWLEQAATSSNLVLLGTNNDRCFGVIAGKGVPSWAWPNVDRPSAAFSRSALLHYEYSQDFSMINAQVMSSIYYGVSQGSSVAK